MIEVFGRPTSSNVQIVMWAIAELDLPYLRHDIGHNFGGNQTDEFRAMNPNGLVPVIRDDQRTFFESAAILRYLAAAYGSDNFYPRNAGMRAELDMWAEWIKTTFTPIVLGRLFYPLVRRDPALIDQNAISAAANDLKPLIMMLERRIGDGPYLGGDDISFADIMIGHLLFRYYVLDFEKIEAPAVWDYYQRLCERPAYQKHIMVDFESLRWGAK
ncbi:MAG: glutathione S-transferase family protein [Paracoccaceae bacterium]|nr:glutathione S-transferase family protein [Paracoccaceae bacterium]